MSEYDDDRGRRRRFEREDDAPYDRPPESNGMAVAALVLGLISFCIGPLVGIPAIICGVLGLSRANRVGGVGRGMATAGLVLGVVGTVLIIPVLIGLLLPAVQKVREAAARAQDASNLKQIVLAQHIYASAHGDRLSPPFVLDPNGEPNRGLSWRVAMLPYLEQDNVYRMFDLSQPWNSPANRLASQMILRTYQSAGEPPDDQTRYRVFVGPGTLFEDSPEWQEKASISRIPDGTSNTLMVIETADRVPWAAYQEVPYQPGGPLPPIGSPHRNMAIIAMGDGSVQAINKNISPQILHALISRDGGEFLPPDWGK